MSDADQRQVALRKFIAEQAGGLGKIPERPQLRPAVASGGDLIQNRRQGVALPSG